MPKIGKKNCEFTNRKTKIPTFLWKKSQIFLGGKKKNTSFKFQPVILFLFFQFCDFVSFTSIPREIWQ
jgi:hypothetical protein